MPDFARFDSRHYPTVGVREGYEGWSPSYEATVPDAMDLALLDRVEHVPWKDAARVADLGCGTGRVGAWLAARGARGIDGVDLTRAMLDRARERQLYARIVEADVRASGLPSVTYDVVTCSLVDEHLPELEPLYAEAARLLRPGGHLVLVGYHPFFVMAAGMPTHFEAEGAGPIAIETHVHLFGEHVRAARTRGFHALELHERLVDDEWVAAKPKWGERRDWPVSFAWVWEARRP